MNSENGPEGSPSEQAHSDWDAPTEKVVGPDGVVRTRKEHQEYLESRGSGAAK